jgi:pimeloyl-ACP methyl ester carboxylesterase
MTAQQGFTAHVATLGTGPRKLLALHCTLAFSGAWGGLARQMAEEVTIIAPDMPSHGRSPDWDEQSSFPDTVFEAALSCLTEPMDVLGHSFGGASALRIAVERPDLVRSLTMVEPVFFCIAQDDAPEVAEANRVETEPFYNLVQAGNSEEAARVFNRSWSDGPLWADLPEQVRAAMARGIHVVPGCTAFLIDDSASLKPRLQNATMPTLLVRGEITDEVVKVTNAGLARRLPNTSEAVIEGAGHMAPVTHPAAMADLLRGLWSEMGQELEHPVR